MGENLRGVSASTHARRWRGEGDSQSSEPPPPLTWRLVLEVMLFTCFSTAPPG